MLSPVITMIRAIFSSAAVSLLLFLSGGCVSPEPAPGPLPVPELVTSVRHLAGSPYFEAAYGGEVPDEDQNAFLVRVDLVALEFFPDNAFEPLADQVRMISVTGDTVPLLPASRLTRGARMGSAPTREALRALFEEEDFGRQAHIATLFAALRPDVTAAFESLELIASPHPHTWEPIVRRSELRLQRPTGEESRELRIVLALEDLVEPAIEGDEDPDDTALRRQEPAVLQREEILLDPRTIDGSDFFVLLFSSPFGQGAVKALAAIVEIADRTAIGGTDTLRLEEALTRCAAELNEHPAATSADPDPSRKFTWLGLESALGRLAVPGQTRGALLYLADATDAALSRDLALAADDVHVDVVAESLLDAIGHTPPDNAAGLGWLLEQTTYRLLTEYARNEGMTPELEGALVRHAGELGRHPSDLDDAVMQSRALEEFRERVLQENRLFLEDFSPAARIRAFDWLAAQSRAPAGYDPMASLKERRAALEKAYEADAVQNAAEQEATGQNVGGDLE